MIWSLVINHCSLLLLFLQVEKNMELIFQRLPSYPLLQCELIESLDRPVTQHLLKMFGLEETVEEDSDLEDLQTMLCAFISSYGHDTDDTFHRLFELLTVFPTLDFELVQSLLDSADGKLSNDMIHEFVELAAELEVSESKRVGDESGSVSVISVSSLLATDTIDRKTLLIITDDDEDGEGQTEDGTGNRSLATSTHRHVVGVAMGRAYGLNTLYAMQESSHTTRRPYLEWGLQDLHICCQVADESESERQLSLSIETKQVYITSVVYEYIHCLERTFDLFHYGWGFKGGSGRGGDAWTPALEEAMLYLLLSVDDDLVVLVRSWKSMMSAFGPGGGGGMTSDLENMLQMVQADATEALRTQSANAIGRLHQVLTQFAEMSSGPMGAMMNIPSPFLHCIEQFILAKLKAAETSHRLFLTSMIDLVACGKKYSLHLKSINFSVNKIKALDDFIALYEVKIPVIPDVNAMTAEDKLLMNSFFDALTPSDIKTLEALKPSQLDSLLTGPSSSHYTTDSLCFMPALSLHDIADPHALTQAVTSLAEKTYNDAITLGSGGDVGVGGYTMSPNNRSVTCAMLSSLLNAGVAYVATKETAKLMGHLPMWRSTLALQPKAIHGGDCKCYLNDLPTPLKKRIKDMKRIFRNKIKKQLSFRLNFDISHAVSLLREHHGVECWVGQELEQVWNLMAATNPPQLMIFELYYGDTLVAADFAHPVCGGSTVYVATRFSARGHSKTSEGGSMPEHWTSISKEEQAEREKEDEEEAAAIRTMQPGFILALLECRWLQQRGCELWDLGGYNLSPLMQYKLDLAGQPKMRPHGLYEFRQCLQQSKRKKEDDCAGVDHPWIDIGAEEELETTAATLFATVCSGDILIENVKIEDLLGHSSVI